jgi:hypothetical protein
MTNYSIFFYVITILAALGLIIFFIVTKSNYTTTIKNSSNYSTLKSTYNNYEETLDDSTPPGNIVSCIGGALEKSDTECKRGHGSPGCGGASSYVQCSAGFMPYNINDEVTTPSTDDCLYGCSPPGWYGAIQKSLNNHAIITNNSNQKSPKCSDFDSRWSQQDNNPLINYDTPSTSAGVLNCITDTDGTAVILCNPDDDSPCCPNSNFLIPRGSPTTNPQCVGPVPPPPPPAPPPPPPAPPPRYPKWFCTKPAHLAIDGTTPRAEGLCELGPAPGNQKGCARAPTDNPKGIGPGSKGFSTKTQCENLCYDSVLDKKDGEFKCKDDVGWCADLLPMSTDKCAGGTKCNKALWKNMTCGCAWGSSFATDYKDGTVGCYEGAGLPHVDPVNKAIIHCQNGSTATVTDWGFMGGGTVGCK